MFYNRIAREFSSENGFFRGFSHEMPLTNRLEGTCVPADILETDEQFIIELALPGVVVDDVQIKMEGSLLHIEAKRTPVLFEERATFLKKELPAHFMYRSFEFECPIIAEQIEARLERGILYISIPKVEAAFRIPVTGGMIESHMSNTVKTRVASKHDVAVK
ncbi:MAG: Hsp20/alpha crystallin family protein [Candidatus Obscuribacterales bacterium]|nr:Hsp20/alpha crystallin family protein [Candidatus Obscuribacterales bacterium]